MDTEEIWKNLENEEGCISPQLMKTIGGSFSVDTWLFGWDDRVKIRNPPDDWHKSTKPGGTLLAPFAKEHFIEYFPSIKRTVLYSRDPVLTKKGTKWVKNAKPEKPPKNLNIVNSEEGPVLYSAFIDKSYQWMSKLDDGTTQLILLANEKSLMLFEIPADEPPTKGKLRSTKALESIKEFPLNECGFMTSYGKNQVMVIKPDGNGTIFQLKHEREEYELQTVKTFKFPTCPEKVVVDDKLNLFFVLREKKLSVYKITSEAFQISYVRGVVVEQFHWSHQSRKVIVNNSRVYHLFEGNFKLVRKFPKLEDSVITRDLVIGVEDTYLVCIPLKNPSKKKTMKTYQEDAWHKLALAKKPKELIWFERYPSKSFWKKDCGGNIKILDEERSLLLHVHAKKHEDPIGWVRDCDDDIEYGVCIDTNDILGYDFKDLGVDLKLLPEEPKEDNKMVPEEEKKAQAMDEEEAPAKKTSAKKVAAPKGQGKKGSAKKEEIMEEKKNEVKNEKEEGNEEEENVVRRSSRSKSQTTKTPEKNSSKKGKKASPEKSVPKGKGAKNGSSDKKQAASVEKNTRKRKQPQKEEDESEEEDQEVKKSDKRAKKGGAGTTKKKSLNLKPTDTVTTLMSEIELQENLKPGQHKLIYRGTELKSTSDKTLTELDMIDGSTIHLVRKPIKILVMELTGKIYHLEVGLKDTISSIKAKIEKYCGVSSHRQILFHASRPLADSVTLSKCYIREGSILNLFINPKAA